MNESDRFDGQQGGENQEKVYTDPYTSESSADIYATPDVTAVSDVVEPEVVETHGLFSGTQQENNTYPIVGSGYGGQPYGNSQDGYGNQMPYGDPQNGYGSQQPYGSQTGSYGGQPYYGNQQSSYGGQSPYGNQAGGGYGGQSPYGEQTPYGNQAGGYGGQSPYGEQAPYGNQAGGGYGGQSPYGEQMPYGSQAGGYGGQSLYGEQTPYGNQAGGGYGGQPPYGEQTLYGSQAGGGYGGQPPYGNQPPYDNPYSPYAMPQKKQHTGLIIGIVVAVIILFLVAVFALASRAVNLLSEKEKENLRRDVYEFDDDYRYDNHFDYDDEYDIDDFLEDDYSYDFDYDYNDYFEDGYDDYDYDNEKYYILHSDIKDDLSYQVELDYYEYETDYENVLIMASYPTISGEEVPNLDKLNEAVRKELDEVTDLFEEEYESHVKDNGDAYFEAVLSGYVTYMDEDKLSIAYEENIYSDTGGGVYLISVNVDMKNGVVLDNKEMLMIDDAFSVDFRQKSDEQNGEVDSLTYMTDQEITKYFNSDNIIVFYTPKGMEIGFNYELGWVTVTYEEYEEYLKVF